MAVVLPNGRNYFTDSLGNPLIAGKVYAFIPNTTTPKDTYATSAGASGAHNQHPIVLDVRGEAAIYWDGAYDVLLKTAAGVTIWGPERLETPESGGAVAALESDLANTSTGSKGAGLVGYGSVVSYPVGTVGAKLEEFPSAKDFGAKGDGATDDTSALATWLSSGKHLYLPPGLYKQTSKLQTVAGSTIYGAGRGQSVIKKFFDGDQLDWASGVAFVDMELDGNGGSYTGSNAVISSGSGQAMLRSNFNDAETNPIRFTAANVGTVFSFISSQIRSHTLTNGGLLFHSGDTSVNTKGEMINIDCSGGNLFDIGTGAVGGLKAIGCTAQGVTFGDNCVNIVLIGCRIATYEVHVKGTNVQIYGCALSEHLYLDASAAACVIGPNALAGGKVIVNNSINTNEIYGQQAYVWAPVLSLVNSIGNGSLTGVYSRNGNSVTATVSFAAGSSTTFNTGTFTCSLPVVSAGGGINYVGTVRAFDNGTNFRTGIWVNSSNSTSSVFFHDTATAEWSNTTPFTWAVGDTLNATITYDAA